MNKEEIDRLRIDYELRRDMINRARAVFEEEQRMSIATMLAFRGYLKGDVPEKKRTALD